VDAAAHPLPMVTVSESGDDGSVLQLPAPRAALLHSIPTVLEGVVAPAAVFYVVLVLGGFRAALVAAFVCSMAALARRVVRRDRVSTVLAVGAVLLALRTAFSLVTKSPTLYFVPPMASSVVASVVLIGSAVVRRPLTQRFAEDFCPWDPRLLRRPRVQQFFVRISVMWAAVLLANTGLVLWLLLSTSLKSFVLERTAITWGSTIGAIACSIFGFTYTMRRDGIAVRWGGRPIEDQLAEAA